MFIQYWYAGAVSLYGSYSVGYPSPSLLTFSADRRNEPRFYSSPLSPLRGYSNRGPSRPNAPLRRLMQKRGEVIFASNQENHSTESDSLHPRKIDEFMSHSPGDSSCELRI